MRRLLAGVGVLSLVAVVAGLVAFGQARRAGRAAVVADARRVGAQALATDEIDRSLLLAVEGVHLDDSPDTRTNLLTALGRSPQLAGVLRPERSGQLGAVTVSHDGRTIAVYDNANRLHFHDVDSRERRGTFATDDVIGTATHLTGRATFHPDGGPVAVSVSTLGARPVRLLDPDTLQELPEQLDGFPGSWLLPWDVAYSPDGRRVAVAFDRYPGRDSNLVRDSVVAVWDIEAPDEPVAVLNDVPRFTHGVAFGPDGRVLYTGTHAAPPMFDTEPAVTVFDFTTATVERTLHVPSHPFALSPDGTRMAARAASDSPESAAANEIVVVDAVSGDELARLRGHTGAVSDVAFSPDGRQLASASSDRTVAVWDVANGTRIEQLEGHAGDVSSVAFGRDGRTLLSAGDDRAVMLWDRAGAGRFVSLRATVDDLLEGGNVNRLEGWALLSPAGDRILYERTQLDDEGRPVTVLQVVDSSTGRSSDVLDSGHGPFAIASWHPGGARFASTGFDGVVRLWDAATATVIAERQMGMGALPGLAFLGDGGDLLVGGFGGPMRRVDGDTLAPVDDLFATPAGGPVWTYASPDGRTAAVITGQPTFTGSGTVFRPDDRVLLIDAVAGEVVAELDLGFDGEWADFSSDGAFVALTGRDGQIAVVDVAAGALAGPVVEGHDGNVVSVSYSPDGDLVASGGTDGRVSLWDGRSGALLGSVRVGRPDAETYVGFDPAGRTVTVATFDGRIHAFDTRSEAWVAHACTVAGRDLTAQEWRNAFGARPYRATCGTG